MLSVPFNVVSPSSVVYRITTGDNVNVIRANVNLASKSYVNVIGANVNLASKSYVNVIRANVNLASQTLFL